MKKTVRFFAKVFLAVSAVTAVLFTIYMTRRQDSFIWTGSSGDQKECSVYQDHVDPD